MSHNFEKSVKGATKIKLAAPKSKYIEHILVATHTGEAGVAEIFRTLQLRLRDSTWTIVFKALIVVHIMIREGQLDATLQYMAENTRRLAISGFSEAQSQGHNIRRYSDYLVARANAFEATKTDYLLTDEVENEITLTAFRLLTLDLLTLYSVMNEGTINVLEHYFEMSRPDSERALDIYKTFTQQTEEVVKFLGVARHFQAATRLEIPKLKHASTDLTRLLEDDLNDPDFDQRRREYLLRKGRGNVNSASPFASNNATAAGNRSVSNPNPPRPQTEPALPKKENPTELIDFFDTIDNPQPTAQQNPMQQPHLQQQPQAMQFQQTGFQQQQPAFYPQQTGFQQQAQPTGFGQPMQFGDPYAQQNGNPFGQQPAQQQQPLQPTPTGAGFGGYSAQPQTYSFQGNLAPAPQNVAPFSQQQQQMPGAQLQQQTTNPFRQSMLMSTPTGNGLSASPMNRQSTNPFARRLSSANPPQFDPNTFPAQQPPQQPSQRLQPQRTGTNPFARSSSVPPQQSQGLQPPAPAPLRPNPTGSTNPFRQSAFVNQQTGQGWHVSGQQGTMGGFEQLETVPVFPRPGM
ncbi:hypothetical protein BBP40_008283 [Aspergillus hancockii]|nr:hypothetical protein BBP40_008283 [Aspergillus hancockii]